MDQWRLSEQAHGSFQADFSHVAEVCVRVCGWNCASACGLYLYIICAHVVHRCTYINVDQQSRHTRAYNPNTSHIALALACIQIRTHARRHIYILYPTRTHPHPPHARTHTHTHERMRVCTCMCTRRHAHVHSCEHVRTRTHTPLAHAHTHTHTERERETHTHTHTRTHTRTQEETVRPSHLFATHHRSVRNSQKFSIY